MLPRRFILPLFLVLFLSANAAVVDTISIYSYAMGKDIKCVVIKPDSYELKTNSYPVVYLLHGYGGWYSNWIIRVPQLKEHADAFQLIIVCPDGHGSSWYIDSPVDPTMKYETHVGKEVPDYIDAHYNTIKNRTGRAITGLSMGGHGGLFLGFRHADLFGACGSMSGVVDLNFVGNKYDLMKRIGDTILNADSWKKFSVIHIIENVLKDSLAIIIDCGNDDQFATINRQLHAKMLSLKIPHEYTERPGKHDWNYWRNSIQYHLLFFRNYFNKMKMK